MYHEIQIKNGEKYHYLTENFRINDKWKKIRIYLGKGNIKRKKFEKLISEKKVELELKLDKEKKLNDPLLSFLTEQEIKKIEKMKKHYQKSMKNIDKQLWKNYYESFITEFTYDTNAIEGSSVTLQETGLILFDRVVPEGKTIKEIKEVENHKEAFDFMIKHEEGITKRFVLQIHKKLMHNILWDYAGKFRDVQVIIRGSDFLPPPPAKVESDFKTLMRWYGSNKKKYHPVIIAAYFHSAFESVHPFRDGNGRTGRLLLNFILKKNGYPMIDIKNKDRMKYYNSLKSAEKNGDLRPLVNLIVNYLLESKIWI
ncbi:MAG: Fic family protein [Candidatus Aenigmarchaeota archaeon]|nr:Fic family protein [Candidatus Aenigmarchaeota archaeon]